MQLGASGSAVSSPSGVRGEATADKRFGAQGAGEGSGRKRRGMEKEGREEERGEMEKGERREKRDGEGGSSSFAL